MNSLASKNTLTSILRCSSLFAGLLVLLSTLAMAQSHPHRCSSMECLQAMKRKDPGLAARMAAIEAHTATAGIGGTRNGGLGIITIPVVVHVVYATPSQNISNAQIQSQIDVLNEDFRRQNPDAVNTPSAFQSVAADTEIQFCLATVDPNGNPTTGITRTATNVSAFSGTTNNVKFTNQGGKDAWPRDQYLNVWVCPLQSGLLGYAQFPGGAAATDGVVVTTTAFGRTGNVIAPSDRGRTATHEVGHWLNLRHIWGDGPCGQDDFVNDTPGSDAPNYGCQIGTISCGTVDMVQNYMDYSDDACMNLFTAGQKARMRALFVSGGFREPLLTSPGCGGGGGTNPNPTGSYQLNGPVSALMLGGVSGTATTPAVTSVGTNVAVPLQVGTSSVGAPYEALFNATALVPSGMTTGGGQIVNVDYTHPTFTWAFGSSAAPSFQAHPGSYTTSLSSSAPGTFSFQMIVLGPQNQDGYSLSQGCQLDVTGGGGTGGPALPAGPTSDDGTVTVSLGSMSMNFYGQTYTELHVSANGRVTFGAADGNYNPTISGAATGQPMVGFWTDLDVTLGGSIDIVSPAAGVIRVEYNNVPYWGEPFAFPVNFAIEINTNNSKVALDGLQGIPQNPQYWNYYSGQSQFLGMSAGGTTGTFAGFSAFGPGQSGGSTAAGPMLFDWYAWNGFGGLAGSLYGNLDRVEFTPAAGGGYSWQGF